MFADANPYSAIAPPLSPYNCSVSSSSSPAKSDSSESRDYCTSSTSASSYSLFTDKDYFDDYSEYSDWSSWHCECCSDPYRYNPDVYIYQHFEMEDTYRDFRSPSREKQKWRKRNKKYSNFKEVHEVDLPPKKSSRGKYKMEKAGTHKQRAHYLPVCLNSACSSFDTADGHCWSSFPADLSTAPIAKFTKTEAWQLARPYHPHHSYGYQNWAKDSRKRTALKEAKREIRGGTWESEVDDEECWQDWVTGSDMHALEFYLTFRYHRHNFESSSPFTVYAPETIIQGEMRRWNAVREWTWHRNATGCWEADEWECCCMGHHCCPDSGREKYCEKYCEERGCFVDWGRWHAEGPQAYTLARWVPGMLKGGRLWEEEGDVYDEGKYDEKLPWEDLCVPSDLSWEELDIWFHAKADWGVEEEEWKAEFEWDIVSTASSGWTEVENVEVLDAV